MSIYLRTEKIIPDWTDYNGHMNLAFYIHLFDQGWDVLLDKFHMGGESAKTEQRSTFAVESHTKYIQEVKEPQYFLTRRAQRKRLYFIQKCFLKLLF